MAAGVQPFRVIAYLNLQILLRLAGGCPDRFSFVPFSTHRSTTSTQLLCRWIYMLVLVAVVLTIALEDERIDWNYNRQHHTNCNPPTAVCCGITKPNATTYSLGKAFCGKTVVSVAMPSPLAIRQQLPKQCLRRCLYSSATCGLRCGSITAGLNVGDGKLSERHCGDNMTSGFPYKLLH